MSDVAPDDDQGKPVKAANSALMNVLRELGLYIWEGRKFWLVPIVAALLLVGGLVAVSNASPLSPFIYPFF
jgi:hypothetical protein